MAGFLGRLFRKRHPLRGLASSGHEEAFVDALTSMDVILLGTTHSQGLAIESATEEALLAEIKLAAEMLKARQTFSPFVYEDHGAKYRPFFTSTEAADEFCGAFCGRENRLFQFPAFRLEGFAVASLASPGVSLVMDPQTDDELVLSDEQVKALQAYQGTLQATDSLDISGLSPTSRYLITPAC